MQIRHILLTSSLAFLVSCATTPATQPGSELISPVQAVIRAADAAPVGVRGTFDLVVRRVGRQDGNIYLDSEMDYRDQRNLVIAVHPIAARKLHDKFGRDVDEALMGKHINVFGEARRTKIVFYAGNRISDKYYYQTHVDVWDSGQIVVLP